MSRKANKTVIGVFVIGALVLLMAAIVVFGSGELFKRTNKFVLYFDGSVKGLSIGAPVMFRGVSIGTVKDISLIYDAKAGTITLPVIVEIEQDRIKGASMSPEMGPVYSLSRDSKDQPDFKLLDIPKGRELAFDGSPDGKTFEEIILTGYSMSVQRST